MADSTPDRSGTYALGFAIASLVCFELPRLIIAAPTGSRGDVGSDFATGMGLVGGAVAFVFLSVASGGAAIIAALVAMRRGQRVLARASLLVVLGVVVAALFAVRQLGAGLPDARPAPKIDRDCAIQALNGEEPSGKCREPAPTSR